MLCTQQLDRKSADELQPVLPTRSPLPLGVGSDAIADAIHHSDPAPRHHRQLQSPKR
jgi:hypothetical protein